MKRGAKPAPVESRKSRRLNPTADTQADLVKEDTELAVAAAVDCLPYINWTFLTAPPDAYAGPTRFAVSHKTPRYATSHISCCLRTAITLEDFKKCIAEMTGGVHLAERMIVSTQTAAKGVVKTEAEWTNLKATRQFPSLFGAPGLSISIIVYHPKPTAKEKKWILAQAKIAKQERGDQADLCTDVIFARNLGLTV